MKVIVLGGAGDMGTAAVLDLAANVDVTRLTIADYHFEAAQRLAVIAGPKAQAVWVDANDHDHLVKVISGHDVAANAIGPFYKYEAPIAAAAIHAGVPYISLCDDYDAAQAVLELNALAQEKGMLVLTGLGWTPGLSNVLARKAASELDEVSKIHISWGSSASDSEGYAVILHTIHIFTGMVPSYMDGHWVDVPAGSDRELVRFPDPLGDMYVYHLGHPEPVTLPRFLPGIQTVSLKGGLVEDELNRLAMILARLGFTESPEKREQLGKILKKALPLLERIGAPAQPCSGIRVDAHGTKGGKKATISYGASDHMKRLTGIPLAVGAAMIGKKQITGAGVLAPEACVPVDLFLGELARRDVIVQDMSRYVPGLRAPRSGLSWSGVALTAAITGLIVWALTRRE